MMFGRGGTFLGETPPLWKCLISDYYTCTGTCTVYTALIYCVHVCGIILIRPPLEFVAQLMPGSLLPDQQCNDRLPGGEASWRVAMVNI